MTLIEATNLTKQFSRPDVPPGRFAGIRALVTRSRAVTTAVDNLSLRIAPGEIVGFLGPNGAGKSTTIKMLTGILTPTSGSVVVAGHTPWRHRRLNAQNIGVVFGQRTQLWYDLPLMDSFEIVRDLYDIDHGIYRRRLAKFSELLELDDFISTPVRSLSLGQRMRGDLVAAMLHDPRILFLDEPTVGLDVVAKGRIRDFIADANIREGTTVILTTHDMEDVEKLCRRAVIIDHGRLLYEGGLNELKTRYAVHREVVVHCGEFDGRTLSTPFAEIVSADRGQVVLRFDPREVDAPTVVHDLTARYPITDLAVREVRLEDIIRRLYTSRDYVVS
ncbi:ATP-binding cassette domain-containing protein [Amycolatopsis sp. NPDC049868]|uniref:ATP-binding cassette domain-containing protein n=1 Tax=Amycolatopsis sp. NPDC049868 TaxID=3363934 RepID=UPI0037873883